MEKYGTIPPRFTKDWWAHYWHYYKIHIIFGAIMLVAVIYLIAALNNKVEYDLNIEIITQDVYLQSDTSDAFSKCVHSIAYDATGDNEIKVECRNDTYVSSPGKDMSYVQQNSALITRISAEAKYGEKQLYIVDKTYADSMVGFECMLPVKEWAGDAYDERIYQDVFLSLEGNTTFSEMGFDTTNLYIGVLELRDKVKDNEEIIKKQENAKHVAQELIKE